MPVPIDTSFSSVSIGCGAALGFDFFLTCLTDVSLLGSDRSFLGAVGLVKSSDFFLVAFFLGATFLTFFAGFGASSCSDSSGVAVLLGFKAGDGSSDSSGVGLL